MFDQVLDLAGDHDLWRFSVDVLSLLWEKRTS